MRTISSCAMRSAAAAAAASEAVFRCRSLGDGCCGGAAGGSLLCHAAGVRAAAAACCCCSLGEGCAGMFLCLAAGAVAARAACPRDSRSSMFTLPIDNNSDLSAGLISASSSFPKGESRSGSVGLIASWTFVRSARSRAARSSDRLQETGKSAVVGSADFDTQCSQPSVYLGLC